MSAGAIGEHGAPFEHSRPSWAPLVVVGMAQVLLVFNSTALKVSVDALADSLGSSASTVKTTIVIYSLVVATLTMLGTHISGRFGAWGVFRTMIAAFALSMMAMALSRGVVGMIVAQVVAAVATASLVPTFVVLVAASYEGERQSRAMGWLAAAHSIGIVPALLIAGLLATWVGWRYTYGLLVLIALIICALSAGLRRNMPRAETRMDGVGLLLAACAIFLIGVGCNNLSGWGAVYAKPGAPFQLLAISPALLVIVLGAVFLKLFLLWSRRLEASGGTPLVALDVFASKEERAALISIFLIGVIGSAITFVIPLYIEVIQGRNALYTAGAVIPFALASFVAAIAVVKLRERIHPSRVARYAFLCVAFGSAVLGATIHNDWNDAAVLVSMTVAGAGEGALATLLFKLLASRKRAADVGPLCGTTDYLAAAVGTSVASALVIGMLAAGVSSELTRNSVISQNLKSQVDIDNAAFISNDQLRVRLSNTSATQEEVAEAVRINTAVRLRSLKICLFTLAVIALFALLPSAALPDYARGHEDAPRHG
jgi:predicted MFS family arabinose efflux permease